jgi:hypothetical protein
MRKFSTAAFGGALALFLCVSVAQAQPELLLNADLDLTSVSSQVLATPDNWTVIASRAISGPFNDGASSEGFANVIAAGGQGLFFKPFQGNATDGDLTVIMTQTVPGTAGQTYFFRGWAGAGAGYIGLTDPTVDSLFQMEFLDAGSSPIGGATLDLTAAGLRTAGLPNPFGYLLYGLSATAPAGTSFVRVSAQMIDAYSNPAGGDQAFVVDGFSLKVPEPGSLSLLSLGGLALVARRRTRIA